MSRVRRPLIALDFDGVIHSYKSGWVKAHIIPDGPIWNTIDWLITAFEKHDQQIRVAIFSTRNRHLLGRGAMRRYIRKAVWERCGDIVFADDLAGWLEFPWFKPPAIVFVDDRAFRFEGTMPSVGELWNMKPWFRK